MLCSKTKRMCWLTSVLSERRKRWGHLAPSRSKLWSPLMDLSPSYTLLGKALQEEVGTSVSRDLLGTVAEQPGLEIAVVERDSGD